MATRQRWGRILLALGLLVTTTALITGIQAPSASAADPATAPAATPWQWEALSAGEGHTCGRDNASRVYCWGTDTKGRLGDGADDGAPELLATPIVAPGSHPANTWREVFAGTSASCAIADSADSRAFCWGNNAAGQLGDTQVADSPVPIVVWPTRTGTVPGWKTLAPGGEHVCGISTTDQALCWGANRFNGALGNGSANTDNTPHPQPVVSPIPGNPNPTWTAITSGTQFSCGLIAGTAYCWGSNSTGQLGNSVSGANSRVPVAVALPPAAGPVASIAAGANHTCVVTTTAAAYCWGWNESGQLGLGNSAAAPVLPQLVQAPAGGTTLTWLSVKPGRDHTCGLTTDRALYCWGTGWGGQLGSGATVSTRPRAVTTPEGGSATGWRGLTVGDLRSCAISARGTAHCWGPNYLGTGPGPAGSATPVPVGQAQTLDVSGFADREFGAGPLTVRASASSGLPVVPVVRTPLTCQAATPVGPDLRIDLLGEGLCTVSVTQPGSPRWAPAASVDRSFTIHSTSASIDVTGWTAVYDTFPHPVTVTTDPPGLSVTVTYTAAGGTATSTPPVDAGEYLVRAVLTAPGYTAAEQSGTLEIGKGTPTISLGSLTDLTWDDPAPRQAATVTVDPPTRPVSLSVHGSCMTEGNTVVAVSTGPCTVSASSSGDANWHAVAAAPATITVHPGAAAVELTLADLSQVFGATRPVGVTTSPAGLAHRVTYDGSDTVPSRAGTYVVRATITDPHRDATSVQGSLVIDRATPTVTLPAVPDRPASTDPVPVAATTTSGHPVTLTVNGPCTIDGATSPAEVTLTGVGDCTVTATDNGSSDWHPAWASTTFTISAAPVTVALTGPTDPTRVGVDATFTATVSSASGTVPDGIVTFAAAGETYPATLVDGVATWTTDALPAGAIEVSATYEGSGWHAPADVTTVVHDVELAPTALSGLPNELRSGDPVTVTVTGFAPGETVTFTLHSDPIDVATATADLFGTATASFTVPTVPPGDHVLRAVGAESGQEVEAATRVLAPIPSTTTTIPGSTTTVPGSVPGSTVPGSTVPGSTVPGSTVPGSGSTLPGSTTPGGRPGAGSTTPGGGNGAGGQLPRTGSRTVPLAALGLSLLLAGAVLTRSGRPRTSVRG